MRIPSSITRFPWLLADGWFSRFFDSPPTAPRLGLVLSCGGARGLSHVGVIQVLEEENIPISAIMGCSMGSYVGALWASGVNGHELERLAAEIKDRRTLLRLLDPVYPPTSGFIHGNKIRKHLERNLGTMTLAELKTPTYIVATNLDDLMGEVLPPTTPVAAAVHASSAIPAICAPVFLNGKRYIDGGAAEPLPVSLLKQHPLVDKVIAVNVMATKEDVAASRILPVSDIPAPPPRFVTRLLSSLNRHVNLFAYGNVLDTFKRCLTSAQIRLMEIESRQADVLIHPFSADARWYDYENFARYIELGRKATRDAIPSIRALLSETVNAKPTPKHNHETVSLISSVGCGSPRVLENVAG